MKDPPVGAGIKKIKWLCLQSTDRTPGASFIKAFKTNFVLEDVPGRFKDKNRVSSNSRNLGSSQILS